MIDRIRRKRTSAEHCKGFMHDGHGFRFRSASTQRAKASNFFFASSSSPTTVSFSASVFQFVLPRAAAINRSTQATKYTASAGLRSGAPATDTYTGLVVPYG